MFESGTSDVFSFTSFISFQKLGFRVMALVELFMGSIAWAKFVDKISKTVAFLGLWR